MTLPVEHAIRAAHRRGSNPLLLGTLVDGDPLHDELVDVELSLLLLGVGDRGPERLEDGDRGGLVGVRRIATASLTFLPRTRSATSRTFWAEPFM
jgi:hypothetical protein